MKLVGLSVMMHTSSSFISHMVQMKPVIEYDRAAHKLYFISHMVQMKLHRTEGSSSSHDFFISHMVQMKLMRTNGRLLLYVNFISHMVQMKLIIDLIAYREMLLLYIPHGSDETK